MDNQGEHHEIMVDIFDRGIRQWSIHRDRVKVILFRQVLKIPVSARLPIILCRKSIPLSTTP